MPGKHPGGAGSSGGNDRSLAYERRQFLAALGLTGVAGMAGCGGDGGDGGDSGDGGDGGGDGTSNGGGDGTSNGGGDGTSNGGGDGTSNGGGGDTSDGDPSDPGDGTSTPGEPIDRTWQVFMTPPSPGAAQYNTYNGNVAWAAGGELMRFKMYQKSFVDGTFQPEIFKDWQYTNGTLQADLYEDHYWVSDTLDERNPVNLDADHVIGTIELKNYLQYPSAFEQLNDFEKTGDYQVTLRFDDVYRQNYIMTSTFDGYEVDNMAFFNKEWMPRFDDASTEDAISDVQINLETTKYQSPHPFCNTPFYVSGTTDTSWQLSLRDDEVDKFGLDSNPRWVDETNFSNAEIRISGENQRTSAAYVAGELPFGGSEMGGVSLLDEDVDFATTTAEVPRPYATGAYAFNTQLSPMSNVHFRRAFAYMLDRDTHTTRHMDPDRFITGYLTEEREETYLSSDFLDMIKNSPTENYGYDRVMKDAAEAEMLAGGFERDSDGRWLFNTDEAEFGNEGSPMSFEIDFWPWTLRLASNGTAFQAEMADFGIDVQLSQVDDTQLWSDMSDANFDIVQSYWGGGFPTQVYTNMFWGNESMMGKTGFDSEWEGPTFGEFPEPGESPSGENFRVSRMISGLQVALDDSSFEEVGARLVWVYNQALPHLPIGFEPRQFVMNTEKWNWPLPFDEHPFAWVALPRRRLWQRGVVGAKPLEEDE